MLHTSIPSVKILVPLLLILVLTALMFTLFKKSSKYEIVETRNFSCEGMKGFTFTYPVFKGWEVSTPSNIGKLQSPVSHSCSFTYFNEDFGDSVDLKDFMDINIITNEHPSSMGPEFYKDNPISFTKIDGGYRFDSREFSVDIKIDQNTSVVLSEQFFNTAIESFTLKSPKYEIAETETRTRDFSCEGMKGFTFKYPVFKGWEVDPVADYNQQADSCTIFLNYPEGINFEIAPQIQVSKKTYQEISGKRPPTNPENINKLNPNNIEYGEGKTGYDFVVGNSIIYVSVLSVSEEFGFSREQFFKTVIESFNYK